MNVNNRDLKVELQKLNIVSFDCNGIATKSDILKALDAVKRSIEKTPDEEKLRHINGQL
ncbi:MAG: hypothetical protein HDR52_06250 [Treponema sp.]|nr:hypothetical protein [Treponema sp.]